MVYFSAVTITRMRYFYLFLIYLSTNAVIIQMLNFAAQEVQGQIDAVRPFAMKLSFVTFVIFGVVLLVFMVVIEWQIRIDLITNDDTKLTVFLDQWLILLNLVTLIRDIAIAI